jgi:hypothetical protein
MIYLNSIKNKLNIKHIYTLILGLLLLTLSSCSIFQTNNSVSKFHYSENGIKNYPSNINYITQLSDNKLAFANNDSLFIIKDNQLIGKCALKSITSIVEFMNNFYIGTANGIFSLNDKESVKSIEIPAITSNPRISSLLVVDNQLWIGTDGVGLYTFDGQKIKPISSTPVINCLAVTLDKSVWVGTNSGLFRFFRNGSSSRYSEEIPHDGIALIDNDIRHLQVDSRNNLWLIMVNAVSVFAQDQIVAKTEDHIDPVSFDFIGDDKNSVIKIFDLKDKTNKIVYSDNGIYILSEIDEAEHNHDSDIKKSSGKLKKIEYLKLEDGNIIKIDKILDCHYDIDNNLLISSLSGVYQIPKSIIKKL